MMNRQQFLLSKLAEEASEVAQIALKNQQFDLDEVWPGQQYTNKQRAHAELNDLLAIVEMLNEECQFNFNPSRYAIEAKKEKTNKYSIKSMNLKQLI